MSTPPNLDGAEVYVRADHPDSYGRWYIRADNTVVYNSPAGEWRESMVSAETLRTSPVWKREEQTGQTDVHHTVS